MSANICETCGLPTELCVCEDVAKDSTNTLSIETESRRYGKVVTVITGFDSAVDTSSLASEIKSSLGCGGTSSDDTIELQGSHKERVREHLIEDGFTISQ